MLSQTEKDALLELKSQGYSFNEALSLIGGQRLGAPSTLKEKLTTEETEQTPILPTSLKETAGDVKDVFVKSGERAYKTGEKIIEKAKQGKPLGAVSEFMSGVGKTLGGFFTDTAKIGLSQQAEDKVAQFGENVGAKVANTDTMQRLAKAYEALPDDVKNNIGDAGRFAEGLLSLVGAQTSATGFNKVFGATKTGFSNLSKLSKEAVDDLSKIARSGKEGIVMSKKLGIAPENLMQRVARVSKGKQAAFEETAGESIGSYLVKRDIFGDPEQIAEQLYSRMRESMGKVDSGLSKIKGNFKDASVDDALDTLLEREIAVSTDRVPSKDLFRVTQLQRKAQKEGLTAPEINEVKRLYERNVKVDYLKDNVSTKVEQANQVDSKLRELVVRIAAKNGFKDVAELNKETRLAKQLLDDIGAEYAGQQGNNLVSLSDAFFLAEAASNPSALAAFGLKKTLSSKKVLSATAKLLSKDTGAKKELPIGAIDETAVTPTSLNKPTSGTVPVSGMGGLQSVKINGVR